MREIIFRGKRTDNGEWAEGYLTKRPSAIQYGAHYSPWFIDTPPKDPDDSGDYCNVTRETVGQFTGLYDSSKWDDLSEEEKKKFLTKHTIEEWKGRPIFENDIVGFGDIIGIVNYGTGCYCVKTNKPDWMSRNNPAIDIILNEYPNEIKVIGNIHDNPELL